MGIAREGTRDFWDRVKELDEVKPKFEKDKVILEYLLNNDSSRLRDYCLDILMKIFDKKSFSSSNYDGRWMFVNQTFKVNNVERNVTELIFLNDDSNFKILYNNGPLVEMASIDDIPDEDIHKLTINKMDKYIRDLEDHIETERRLEREREQEEWKEWFYSHY